ncbi:Chondroitin proteoglycan-2 [Trichinella nelsoni]|uniref:Chondroitin proteoglycan-2 n=1 Tax=Trichinella nelsoni TaxID=6336 RepID=A0A0V0RIM2_9BILA|nr:Chondroitin proteoglycan-2 [Trichinella nelsoni]
MIDATAAFALLLSLLASLSCCCCSASQTEFNCSYISDGKYSHPDQPCSPVFYHCFQQVTTIMKCPDPLYFDVLQETCLPRKEVQACFNESIPEENALDCKILADGQYPDVALNCSRKYYKCLAGVATSFTCPGEYLYYDAEEKQCVPYTEIEECSSLTISVDCTKLLSSDSKRHSIADNACSQFFINCENNNFGKIAKCQDDSYSTCSNMPEGMNPIAMNVCSKFYIYCQQNSTPILMKCSYEFYFDSDQNRCVHKKVSKICNIWSGYKNETEQSFINFPVKCSDQMVVGKHAISDDSCSQFYIECENDSDFPIATLKKCKDTLLFDPKNKNCAREEKITSCQLLELRSSTTEQNFYSGMNQIDEFDCHGIGDGNYSISGKGCFNFYYQCIDEVALKLFCSSGLYFDPVSRICSPYENIAYCNQESNLPSKISMKETNFCSPLVNENYPDPMQNCSSKYYTCFNGYLVQRHCEFGKYYDVQSDKCDLFRMVPACSRFGRSNNLRILSTEATPTTASLPTLSFNCENLPDGNWAASACKPYYFACVGGFSFMQPCPPGTYYDPDTDQCNYKSAIPLCGEIVEWISISPLYTTNQPAATATPAPTIMTATTSTTATTTTTTAAAATSAATNHIYSTLSVDCKNLPNGYYADPRNSCSKIYFLCYNGNDYMFYCVGARLFYDPDNGICDDEAHVVACGGSARGIAATASPFYQSSTVETTQQPTRAPIRTLKTTHLPNVIRTRKLTNRIINPTQSATGEGRRTSSSSTATTKSIHIPTRAMIRTTQRPPVVRTRKTVHPWRRITTIKPTHLSSVDSFSTMAMTKTTPSPLITASAHANTSPRAVVKPFVVSVPEIGRVTKAPFGSNQQTKQTNSVQSQHSFSFKTKTSFQNSVFTGHNNTVISRGNNWISIFQRELSADGSVENSRYFLRTRQRAKPVRLGTRKPNYRATSVTQI